MTKFSLKVWLFSVVVGSLLIFLYSMALKGNSGYFTPAFIFPLILVSSLICSIPAAILFTVFNRTWWRIAKNQQDFRVKSSVTGVVIVLLSFLVISSSLMISIVDDEVVMAIASYSSAMLVGIFYFPIPNEHKRAQAKADLLDDDI